MRNWNHALEWKWQFAFLNFQKVILLLRIVKNKLSHRMIKLLLNSVIAKYRNLSASRRSIICLSLRLRQIIDLLATDKSRYFAQPHPIIVNCKQGTFDTLLTSGWLTIGLQFRFKRLNFLLTLIYIIFHTIQANRDQKGQPKYVLSTNYKMKTGAVVRALASHQCDPGSIPRLGVICGLSLLVLYSSPRGFSPGIPVFPSPKKATLNLICVNLLISVYRVPN